MLVTDIVKKWGVDKEHLAVVKKLSRVLFEKLTIYFPVLENYNNENDLKLLEMGAMLHDIGIYFEKIYKISHHKAGAKFIYENKPDEIKEEDLPVLCCLIKYHRKSLPDEKYEFYKMLTQKQKAKVNYLGSIIRLADAFDSLHLNLVEDFNLEYDKNLNILTFVFSGNIMLNTSVIRSIERKKDFFEAVYQTKIKLKGL